MKGASILVTSAALTPEGDANATGLTLGADKALTLELTSYVAGTVVLKNFQVVFQTTDDTPPAPGTTRKSHRAYGSTTRENGVTAELVRSNCRARASRGLRLLPL